MDCHVNIISKIEILLKPEQCIANFPGQLPNYIVAQAQHYNDYHQNASELRISPFPFK